MLYCGGGAAYVPKISLLPIPTLSTICSLLLTTSTSTNVVQRGGLHALHGGCSMDVGKLFYSGAPHSLSPFGMVVLR